MEQVVLVVGEALVDVVRGRDGTERDHAGGSAANAAVALARLGRPVRFVTAYADDAHGHLLADHLGDNGVRLGSDPVILARTATAVATLGEGGAATYDFDIDWRIGAVTTVDVEPVAVVFGSIGAALDPGASQVAELVAQHRPTALTVFDLNARPGITGTGSRVVDRAEQMAALADVVKASDEDLETMWPGVPHGDVAARMIGRGTSALVVTLGEQGLAWFAAGSEGSVPGVAAEVADTIGAGDTVTAAVVDGLWELGVVGTAARTGLAALGADEWSAVLGRAARAAAVTVGRPGGDPPWRHELA